MPHRPTRIVLTGFSGTGKSVVGVTKRPSGRASGKDRRLPLKAVLLAPMVLALLSCNGGGGGDTATPADRVPASAEIVFVSTRDGSFDIYAMNADGSNQTRITDAASDESFS